MSNPAKELEWRKKLDRANAEIAELKAEIAEMEIKHREQIEKLSVRENTVADPARVADALANILV